MFIRQLALCVVVFFLLFVGCNEATDSANTYTKGMIKGLDAAKKIKYTTNVKQLIRMHHTEKGKYPDSLDELGDVPQLPEGWVWQYDNKTGQVDIVKKG